MSIIKVKNRSASRVGYLIPDSHTRRVFAPGEIKEISTEELEKLAYQPGGMYILVNHLQVEPNAVKDLKMEAPEREYYYSEDQVKTLMEEGTAPAFTTVFGNVLGNVLNLFVAVSCLGTLNGLLIGTIRGMYSISVRGMGPKVDLMKQVDPASGMPSNSCIIGLVIVGAWLVYFYGANLTATPWFGKFSFDSSELPIITIYALYIPMFIQFMRKEKSLPAVKRFVLPILGIIGSAFMVFAALYSHGYAPYIAAKEAGQGFTCTVFFYLIVFAVIMAVGMALMKPKKEKK
jgi:amino acid transporter